MGWSTWDVGTGEDGADNVVGGVISVVPSAGYSMLEDDSVKYIVRASDELRALGVSTTVVVIGQPLGIPGVDSVTADITDDDDVPVSHVVEYGGEEKDVSGTVASAGVPLVTGTETDDVVSTPGTVIDEIGEDGVLELAVTTGVETLPGSVGDEDASILNVSLGRGVLTLDSGLDIIGELDDPVLEVISDDVRTPDDVDNSDDLGGMSVVDGPDVVDNPDDVGAVDDVDVPLESPLDEVFAVDSVDSLLLLVSGRFPVSSTSPLSEGEGDGVELIGEPVELKPGVDDVTRSVELVPEPVRLSGT
ncbi:hypothetical protein RRF57_002289 [Xylaria bambusicola]|uniref:Uncharacterized protein n=1 Tax=Xylaria bambusicola TaxID=326684 RepID=A0AAN7UCT2_9PEZI